MEYYSNGFLPSPATPENFTLTEKTRKKRTLFFFSIHCLYYYYYFVLYSVVFLFGFN